MLLELREKQVPRPFERVATILPMDKGACREHLFWSRLNQSVSSFCLDVSLKRTEANKIVCALVGEELEWCGSQSFLFMASRYLGTQRKIQELEAKCKALEASLGSETLNISQLRKQLKQAQLAAEDNDWQLQEQLAHTSNIVSLEKETNNELRGKLSAAQAKLVEVEMFLGSDSGSMALQLEEELAAAKMKIAELEAEKDDLELEMRKKASSSQPSSSSSSSSSYSSYSSSSSSLASTLPLSSYRQEGKENGGSNNTISYGSNSKDGIPLGGRGTGGGLGLLGKRPDSGRLLNKPLSSQPGALAFETLSKGAGSFSFGGFANLLDSEG